MPRLLLALVMLWGVFAGMPRETAAQSAARPNIIVILCDDLGIGDLRCFNPESKITTPTFDRIAAEGMIFPDAHSGSAVCTPTRYGLVTGRYCWRTPLQKSVLGGLSPRLIEPGRMTIASMLKEQGYHTACFGKWHLGMDWEILPGKQVSVLSIEKPEEVWNVDYSKPIKNGPTTVGFDEYCGISASLDMVPYTFIDDDHVRVLPSENPPPFQMFMGRDDKLCRTGPTAPGFDVSHVLPELGRKAVDYIDRMAADAAKGKPFFIYMPLNSPHTAIAPLPEWQGKSGLNYYGDFTMQTDATIGQVLAALDKHKLAENTLVFVTSDNGCSPNADYPELLSKGHNPSGIYRGTKADIFEGGHRVPFLVRWPGKVSAGTQFNQTICLNDIFATCAAIVGATIPANAGEDSVSFLPALTGKTREALREATVHHSIQGAFAIRQGDWKLCLCPDSGGWSVPRPGKDDVSRLPPVQLYNLKDDISEQHNVQAEHPEIVERLTKLLEKYKSEGRSIPAMTTAAK